MVESWPCVAFMTVFRTSTVVLVAGGQRSVLVTVTLCEPVMFTDIGAMDVLQVGIWLLAQ